MVCKANSLGVAAEGDVLSSVVPITDVFVWTEGQWHTKLWMTVFISGMQPKCRFVWDIASVCFWTLLLILCVLCTVFVFLSPPSSLPLSVWVLALASLGRRCSVLHIDGVLQHCVRCDLPALSEQTEASIAFTCFHHRANQTSIPRLIPPSPDHDEPACGCEPLNYTGSLCALWTPISNISRFNSAGIHCCHPVFLLICVNLYY